MQRPSNIIEMNRISPQRSSKIEMMTDFKLNLRTSAPEVPLLRPPNLQNYRST